MSVELVSIVIPAYNVENYISECLDSVVNQTYANIEIIVVDDGSTDDTLKIVTEYAEKDDRIQVFHQQNAGVVVARKNGSFNAKGRYITYIDSDDTVECIYIEKLVSEMGNSDIVVSGHFKDNKHNPVMGALESGYYSGDRMKEIYNNMIIHQEKNAAGIIGTLCTKLLKTELVLKVFHNINESIYYGEDGEFLYKYLLMCKAVSIADYCGYIYRMRENSAMHSKYDDFLSNINKLYLSLKREFEIHEEARGLIYQLERWIASLIIQAPKAMGFDFANCISKYMFSFEDELKGKRLVVYGAGSVGQDYVRYLLNDTNYNLVLWVDKNKESVNNTKVTVSPIAAIKNVVYDYIIVAVKSEKLMLQIKNELVEQGIESHKIIWRDVKNVYCC